MRKTFLSIILLLMASLKGSSQTCNPQFTWAQGSNYEVGFTNTTQFTPSGSITAHYVLENLWSWPVYHFTTYGYDFGGPGTFPVKLTMTVLDTLTQTVYCVDSVIHNVVVNHPPCYTTVSTVDNGSGSYSFTANNIGGGTGLTYTWNFGDGSPNVTGTNVTHSYTYSGTYSVSLHIAGSNSVCWSGDIIDYTTGPLNCDSAVADIAWGQSPNLINTIYYDNNSYYSNYPAGLPSNLTYTSEWDFGDGTTSTQNSGSKTYASPGTYTVTLTSEWIDANTSTVYCTETVTEQVVVTTLPNTISGSVYGGLGTSYVYKVWLITFDQSTNIIDAVDSTVVNSSTGNFFTFSGHPIGDYRVKAAVVAYDPDSTSFAPTYHYSSLNWASANVINHAGAQTTNADILMIPGSTTTGPGFISGNVTQGAGKGTGAGVPNLLILLRNTNTQMERFTYTDANGDYSFGSLPLGTYDVYPENMPQVTTPSGTITIASGSTTVTDINFEKTSTEIKPVINSIEDLAAADLFSVYPNPAADAVTLKWSKNVPAKLNVNIADMTGRIVYEISSTTNTSTSIRLESIPAGMYFIKVASDKAQHTQKLVIQK